MPGEVHALTVPAIELRVGETPHVNHQFPCTLKAHQRFVDGLIDCVPLPADIIARLEQHFGVKLGPRACLVVNDEGLNLGLPLNVWATLIATKAGYGPIVGDALVCDVP